MLTDIYIHRMIAEYETINFRASAVLDIADQTTNVNPDLIRQAAHMVSMYHVQRIARLSQQLAFNLRNQPVLLSEISDNNSHNIERTSQFISDILDQKQPEPTAHTNDEITTVAIALLILANLQAMRHINTEIISRTDDDPLKSVYQTVLHELLADDRSAMSQFLHHHVSPDRTTELGIDQLLQQARQASGQAASIIENQKARQ